MNTEIVTPGAPAIQPITELAKSFPIVDTKKAIDQVGELLAQPITTPDQRAAVYERAKDGAEILKRIEKARTTAVKPFNDHVSEINSFAKKRLVEPLQEAIQKAKGAMKAFDDELERKQAEERRRIEEERRRREEEERQKAREIEERRQADIAAAQEAERKRREEEIAAMPPGPEKARALRELRGETEAKIAEIEEQAEQDVAYHELMASTAHSDLTSAETVLEKDVGRGRQKVWKFEVTDMAALFAARPDLVKAEPRTREITGEIAAGVREIPGIRIYQDSSVVLR